MVSLSGRLRRLCIITTSLLSVAQAGLILMHKTDSGHPWSLIEILSHQQTSSDPTVMPEKQCLE